MLDAAIADPVNYQYLDFLVDDLGLTGTRTWEVGPRIDGRGTDDGDCDIVDWNLFRSGTFPLADANYPPSLPGLQRILSEENPTVLLYSSPGYPTHASDSKPLES